MLTDLINLIKRVVMLKVIISNNMVEARSDLEEAKKESKEFRDDVKLWKRAEHLENTFVREFLLHE